MKNKNKNTEEYLKILEKKFITTIEKCADSNYAFNRCKQISEAFFERFPDDSNVEIIRDSNNKIKSYKFQIFQKNKPSIIGTFDRNEMNELYSLYSFYGTNLPQRIVSRYFPEYSLKQIGEKLNPPVGKSGINHRFKKLRAMADKYR